MAFMSDPVDSAPDQYTGRPNFGLLTRAGKFVRRLPSEYHVGYRSVRCADTRGPEPLFTAAWFAFPPGDHVAMEPRAAIWRIESRFMKRPACDLELLLCAIDLAELRKAGNDFRDGLTNLRR